MTYCALSQNYHPRALVVLLLVPVFGVDTIPLHLDPPHTAKSDVHQVELLALSCRCFQGKTLMTLSLCQAWAFSTLSVCSHLQPCGQQPTPFKIFPWGLWHLLPRVCCSFLHFLECAGELADEVMLPTGVIIIHQELREEGRNSLGALCSGPKGF